MQPAKRRNSSDLVLCGAPAGKVAEPPVSHDDPNHSSLLKAFEAIVAAGRRGLLGLTAKAAADAMPDVDLGGSDGKAAQETPSPVPLVEEKEGEEEKGKEEEEKGKEEEEKEEEKKGKEEEEKEGQKTEKKKKKVKLFTVVKFMPAVGPERFKSYNKEIWILGDSVISSLAWRAKKKDLQIQLDLPSCFTSVTWRGFPQMLWNDLLPILHSIYHKRPFPSIIIIHLGEGDLSRDSSGLLITKIQNDLGLLQRALPGVKLIWSSLLPKLVCKKLQDIESKRRHVNGKMEEYCTENGMCYLSHPLLTVENKALFLPDNTLTNEGADIFVTDLKEILRTNLGLKTC